MREAYQNMNIFQKMSAITAELKTVGKNLDVKAGGGTYKAVAERDILDAVKPLEEKYGIYSYPCDREILEAEMLENEKTYTDRNGNTTVTKSTTFFTRIKTTYKFVNADKPEEFITTITFSEGIDPQDKGSGKAMTYADKYALMKGYKISTGDDPDQDGSEEQNYRATRAQPKKEAPSPIKCLACNNEIKPTTLKNGGTMEPSAIANFSIKRFGACYCPDCQKAMSELGAKEKEPEGAPA